jgi:hypothetical protein
VTPLPAASAQGSLARNSEERSMTALPSPFQAPRPALPFAALLAVLCVLLLAGCWVPERYMARVRIEPDGSYTAYAEGTAVHPDAWRAMRRVQAEARSGALKDDALKKAKEEALAPLLKNLEPLCKDKRFDALHPSAMAVCGSASAARGKWTETCWCSAS